MDSLIPPHELAALAADPSVRICDARFDLRDPDAGRGAYDREHVPGAIHLDLERDLSGREGPRGRHPLPHPHELASRLGTLGIGDEHRVIVYDDGAMMFAARAWWVLRYLGHERVQIVDGGLAAYLEAGLPTTREVPRPAPTRFIARARAEMVADRARVEARIDDPATRLIDARAPARYRGEHEPLDRRAGHIVGAINLPYSDCLDDGRIRSADELRRVFAAADGADEVIVYCGSGVSATVNALAMERAGLPLPRVYVGSWSEWCRDPGAPSARGDD